MWTFGRIGRYDPLPNCSRKEIKLRVHLSFYTFAHFRRVSGEYPENSRTLKTKHPGYIDILISVKRRPGSRQGGQRRVSPPSRRSSASLALACASNRWQSPELAGSPIDKPLPRGYARAVTRTESGLYADKTPGSMCFRGFLCKLLCDKAKQWAILSNHGCRTCFQLFGNPINDSFITSPYSSIRFSIRR